MFQWLMFSWCEWGNQMLLLLKMLNEHFLTAHARILGLNPFWTSAVHVNPDRKHLQFPEQFFLHPHFRSSRQDAAIGAKDVQCGTQTSFSFFHPQFDGVGKFWMRLNAWPQVWPACKTDLLTCCTRAADEGGTALYWHCLRANKSRRASSTLFVSLTRSYMIKFFNDAKLVICNWADWSTETSEYLSSSLKHIPCLPCRLFSFSNKSGYCVTACERMEKRESSTSWPKRLCHMMNRNPLKVSLFRRQSTIHWYEDQWKQI